MVRQQGTTAAPRAARDDGQPMATPVQVEIHGGTTPLSTLDSSGAAMVDADHDNAAAVTRHQAGAALRIHVPRIAADLVVEADGAWSPTALSTAGTAIDAPEGVVGTVTTGLRVPVRASDRFNVSLAFDLGATWVPIHRDIVTTTTTPADVPQSYDEMSSDTVRDPALVARVALVPSFRHGRVTIFGALGASSETVVPSTVTTTGDQGPGADAHLGGLALVAAAGAAIDLGAGTHLTARIGDAFSSIPTSGHYGPQVDLGLSIDLGK